MESNRESGRSRLKGPNVPWLLGGSGKSTRATGSPLSGSPASNETKCHRIFEDAPPSWFAARDAQSRNKNSNCCPRPKPEATGGLLGQALEQGACRRAVYEIDCPCR